MKAFFVVPLLATLCGCASTSITGFSDPSLKGSRYSNIVVAVPNSDFEYGEILAGKVCEKVSKHGVHCVSINSIMPPTKQYTAEDRVETLKRNGVEAAIVIYLGGGGTSTQYLGSTSSGSASIVGNSVYGSSTSTPMYGISRAQGYDVELLDVKTEGGRAWVGGARTSGQGLLNVTDNAFSGSLASELDSQLVKAGFF